ncbi:MAG: hypothetical protein WC749_16700 [Dehalococcoidia bacterium]
MDEKYIGEYEKSLLASFDDEEYEFVYNISPISVRQRNDDAMELSWYANMCDRFHEIAISLPKSAFTRCVECWTYGEKPIVFVKSAWLRSIYSRHYSLFCLVDAIGVKQALQAGTLTRQMLVSLRNALDTMAKDFPEVLFVSMADNTILKSNWTFGRSYGGKAFTHNLEATYKPEIFIRAVQKVRSIYQDELGLNSYAILTQGSNEYYEDGLLHISETKNHICLNSLGAPFAELLSIDNSVRSSIKEGIHPPAELYMDEDFYHSLSLSLDFKESVSKNKYWANMKHAHSSYYYAQCQDILDNIK